MTLTRDGLGTISPVEEIRMQADSRRLTHYTAATVLALLFILFLAMFDWNWLKGPIERRVEAATGRSFVIEGDLHVTPGLEPLITAEGLHLGNAAWADEPLMASVASMQVRIALLPLLIGRVELPLLHLERPVLLLERNQAGDANWTFPDSPGRNGTPVEIGQLTIGHGELRLHEPGLRTDLRLNIRSGEPAAAGSRAPLLAEGQGRYRNGDFELVARVDSPRDLQDASTPYHLDLRVRAGATRAQARGSLRMPLRFDSFGVRFSLSGATLADLYRVFGIVLPDTPPYALDGMLSHEGEVWRYRKFKGTIGDSDLGGEISIDTGGERPYLRGDLVSRSIDFDDLGGFVGAAPATGEGETASLRQRQQAQVQQQAARVLPRREYRIPKLRAMDADVKLRAGRIDAASLPIEGMVVRLLLEDGLLRLDPFNFGVAGGTVKSTVTLDARKDPIASAFDLRAHRMALPKLFPDLRTPGVGVVGGHIRLVGDGNSVAAMLGSADGHVGLVMGPGRFSNLLLELAGLDVAESLRFLLGRDKSVPVRCAFADFSAKDGLLTANGLALDTADTVLVGEGTVSLRDERFAMRLRPLPKDRSPVSLRTPLRLEGTFKSPAIVPEPGPLVLRAAAAAALYAIVPPAALLALIEPGPGRDTDCGASMPGS